MTSSDLTLIHNLPNAPKIPALLAHSSRVYIPIPSLHARNNFLTELGMKWKDHAFLSKKKEKGSCMCWSRFGWIPFHFWGSIYWLMVTTNECTFIYDSLNLFLISFCFSSSTCFVSTVYFILAFYYKNNITIIYIIQSIFFDIIIQSIFINMWLKRLN